MRETDESFCVCDTEKEGEMGSRAQIQPVTLKPTESLVE